MNILIVRVSSLGDVVHNMPMVADIRRHYPHANIDWVVEEAYTSLVRLNPHVRDVIPIALRRWRKSLGKQSTRAEIAGFYRRLRQESYDIVFDTQGLLKTSVVMRMARLTEGGKRIGLANATEGSGYEPLSRIFHTQSIPVDRHTHAVTRARLVAAAALKYTLTSAPDFALTTPAISDVPAWLPQQPYAVFFHGTMEKSMNINMLKGTVSQHWGCLQINLLDGLEVFDISASSFFFIHQCFHIESLKIAV